VLHKMTLAAQKSTFPVALGVRITGVDDSCFAQTGGLIGTQTILRRSLLTLTLTLNRVLLDDHHAQRRLARRARAAGGQH